VNHFKQIMDFDTTKVLLASAVSLSATATAIDWSLRFLISVLTLWYLWQRIHRQRKIEVREERDDEPLD